jgi:hypothetical protein
MTYVYAVSNTLFRPFRALEFRSDDRLTGMGTERVDKFGSRRFRSEALFPLPSPLQAARLAFFAESIPSPSRR